MAFSTYYSDLRDHAFAWALTLSIGLHVLAAIYLPNMHFDQLVPPKILEVKLALPEKPQSEPLNTPEPMPAPPQPQIKPRPAPKLAQASSPVAEPPPSHRPEPTAAPAPPAVISAPAKIETPPAFTAPPPPPEPPKPSAPSQQDMDAARTLYGNLLAREIAKHKQYPKVAQMRGWQGRVIVELQIDGSGNVLSSIIHDPSGYEVLDRQALEMVKKASPFPSPPDALRGRTFNILVPVSFRLE
ncbi:MAG: energy transducer TonB [Methylophilaceae bacterium]